MSINFNVSHISYRFYCDKLSSIDLSKNLIIESSANNIEFKSNNRNISFNNSTIFNSGLNMNDKDLSNIHTIRGNLLNIDTLFLRDISNSLANIVDDNFIEDGYIRGTTIGYNPVEPNIISARDGYFTYIDVSGGDSSFNNSVYIKNSLGVSGTTTISNDLIVNGTSYVTLYNAINNYITNIRQDLSSAKIITKDLSASNISISNDLVVAKTSFINDLSISGHLIDNILKVPHDFTIDPSGHDNASGTLIINGDLIVYGNRTTIASSIVEISDITLSVATNLTISNDLYRNEAGLDISNVASIKYDGRDWNFNGGQLSVENKKVSLDVSLIALKNSVEASLSILNSSFDLSYSQLKNNNDNSFNVTYTKTQIDASFILKSILDVSLDNFKFYVDNSFVTALTVDASFSDLNTYLDASYIPKGTIINPNVIDSSLNFLRNKLDLSFVLKSVFDASYNNLKSQIDASFASVRLTSLDTPSISVDTINSKHSSGQTFNNTLWNQLGLDISNGPPLTNNNNKIAISNDGKVVAMASSSHSDISKGRVYVYEFSYNQASYNFTRLGLSSEIIVGLSNNDEFGWDIALSSNGRVVAGSSIVSDASGINCGQVRLFELSNNVWRQKGLNINGPRANSESGYSISLAGNGNSIAIGAWKDNSNGTNAGAVRVYDFSASINDWRQKGPTIAGVSGSFEGYSTALSLDGQTLACGNVGLVKIFSWSGTTWAPKGTIQGPDISNSYFGRSIKLSANGNAIVSGAPGTKTSSFIARATTGWSFSAWTNDTSIGIEPNSNYNVAVNFGGIATTFNNIPFQASTYNGTNFSIVGGGILANNSSNNINGAGKVLGNNYIYGSSNWTVTLTNLIFGRRYQTTFFSLGNNTTPRNQIFSTGPYINGTSDISTTINPNIYGNNNGILIKYAFVANSTERQVFTINAITSNISDWTWSSRTVLASNWRFTCWSPQQRIFVTIAYGGSYRVMTSSNGIDWTIQTPAENNAWNGICWSPELGIFVAVSWSGNFRVMTSPNGINWSQVTVSVAEVWVDVCWSPQLALFVAISENGPRQVMTSSDGTNWTLASCSEASGWLSVCWSPLRSLFVAVSNGGKVMRSSNGTNWLSSTAAEANAWISVCWSQEAQLFVAVGESGDNRAMISSNGINWSPVSFPLLIWNSVCWSRELGVFLAVAQGGTTNCVMTSPDGTNWTPRTAINARWQNVVWSPELGLFVAVADSGTVAMTLSLTYESAFHFYALTNVLLDKSEETRGGALVYGHQGGTTWSQLGQTLVGISGNNEFGSSVAISNDGTIISVGTNDISSNRGYVNVYKYVNNYWRQISNTLNGKVLSFKAGIHALSGDGTTLFQSNNNYNSVYGINKILALNSPITSISGNLIVIGATSVNSLDISRNHSYSTNGYSYKVFESSLTTAIMKEYYSDVTSLRHLKVQILGNGNITNRNNSYSSLSDSRLKENIVSTSPKLEDLLKVRVVNYNLKGSDNSTYIGVLAQELEELFPNLVTELEPSPKDIQDGNTIKYKTVNYSCFDSLLIKSLQEQNAMLKNIEKRIIALEDE